MATATEERRQFALQKAVEILGQSSDPKMVVDAAEKFEAYLRGK